MSDSILHYRRTAESMADFMLTNGPPPRALSHGKQLKLKQQQFCEYFVHHGNAARAVREAGYSEKNASYQGCRLLRDSRVRAYVHELRQKYALETQWEMEDTLDHLAIIYDCAMTDKNYNAAGRLNTMAVKTLEQAPVPEQPPILAPEPEQAQVLAAALPVASKNIPGWGGKTRPIRSHFINQFPDTIRGLEKKRASRFR